MSLERLHTAGRRIDFGDELECTDEIEKSNIEMRK